MPELSAKNTPFWKDSLLLAAELTARNVYWRLPWLRAWVKRRRAHRRPTPQVADREEIKAYLRSIGVTEGALVMAHTSVSGVLLGDAKEPQQPAATFLASAGRLLDDLLELVGQSGTLVMPTHAVYQRAEDYIGRHRGRVPVVYDPVQTPCAVGLANELFRRRAGVKRSLHPYNTLSACGPLAAELLRDNLNDSKPLAHGVSSGYYRFCRHNGLVISIGVPLRRCLTLVHVAEEVRDRDWPVKDYFEERTYLIRIDGQEKCWVVRQPRPEYLMFSLCLRKATRDLAGAGILHETTVGGVRVDWARSREVFDFMMARNKTVAYPYYWTWLVPKHR